MGSYLNEFYRKQEEKRKKRQKRNKALKKSNKNKNSYNSSYSRYSGYSTYSGYSNNSRKRWSYLDDDDFDYSSIKKNKSWSWGSSMSSWGSSWSSFDEKKYTAEDEAFDKKSYIKRALGYEEPKASYIANKIKSMVSSYQLRHKYNTEENRNFIKELARFFYHKMMGNKDYIADRFIDGSELSEEDQFKKETSERIFPDLWESDIIGYTPTEKAINYMKSIVEEQTSSDKDDSESAKDLKEALAGDEELRSQIEETGDAIGGLLDDPDINDLCDLLKEPYKSSVRNILKKISIIKDFGKTFDVEKEIKDKKVSVSKTVKKKMINQYSDLTLIDKYQMVLPDYNRRLVTKDLVISEPTESTVNKQQIIMLVDFSGSMHDKIKQQWVLALLIDRLSYVMKEEAELYFSFFIETTHSYTHVYNRKTAIDFMRNFSTSPRGGMTDIGSCIDGIADSVPKGKLIGSYGSSIYNEALINERPEVLIINDGQDPILTNKFHYKTNAICLMEQNADLKKTCNKNEGTYIHIPNISENAPIKDIKKEIEISRPNSSLDD